MSIGSGGHVAVLASAGTGKTYSLTTRYVSLIARGAPPESILASTFTRKAAGEILGRVMSRLAGLAVQPELREQFAADTGLRVSGEEATVLAASFARSLHRVSILTLDALFVRMLGGFGLDLGLPPRWSILEEETDASLRLEAIDRAVAAADRAGLASILDMLSSGNPSREVIGLLQRTVDAAHGAWLWAADPAVWTALGPDEPPLDEKAVAALTGELQRAEVPGAPEKPNGHWLKAVRKLNDAWEAGDWEEVAVSGLVTKALAGEKYYSKDFPEPLRSTMLRVAGHTRAVLLERLRRRNESTAAFLAAFDRAYRGLKDEAAAYRFDDVPALLGGAKIDEHLADLYFRLDARFEHALLDEFQDTSLLQFRLIEPLLTEIVAHGDKSRSLLIVGDEKQSLYSWRGAEPGLLSSLTAYWPQMESEPLTLNRRSSPVIIETVNTVFESLAPLGLFKEGSGAAEWIGRFPTQRANKTVAGYAALYVAPDEKEDRPGFVAERIAEVARNNPSASVGVLVRRNSAIPRLKFELARRGIEASEEGGNPVTDAPAVAAAMSALLLALHPECTAAHFHLATGPLAAAVESGDPLDRNACRRVSSSLRRRLMTDGLVAFLKWLRDEAAPSMDARDAFRFEQMLWLAETHEARTPEDPEAFLEIADNRGVEDPSRQKVRIMTVHKSKGLEFDAVFLPDLDALWSPKGGEVLVDRRDAEGRVSPLNPVRAVTVAPGKGLCALDPRLGDLHAQLCDRMAIEELCNLYVAMTRAVHHLEMFIEPRAKAVNLESPTAGKILLCTLTEHDTPVHSAEPIWSTAAQPAWTVSGDVAETRQHTAAPRLRAAEPPRHRWSRVSPSGLEGGSVVDAGDLFGRGGNRARSIGTATHKLLEAVEWWGSGPAWPPADELARELMCDAAEVTESISRLGRDRTTALLARALDRSRYEAWGEGLDLSAHRESGFIVPDHIDGRSVLLNGVIDRLVTASRDGRVVRAEVLDFKTDEVESEAEIAERVAMYRPQIAAYRRAVAKWLRIPETAVGTTLLFLHPGVEVDPLA